MDILEVHDYVECRQNWPWPEIAGGFFWHSAVDGIVKRHMPIYLWQIWWCHMLDFWLTLTVFAAGGKKNNLLKEQPFFQQMQLHFPTNATTFLSLR